MERIRDLQYLHWCFNKNYYFDLAIKYARYVAKCKKDESKITPRGFKEDAKIEKYIRIDYFLSDVNNKDIYPFDKVRIEEYLEFAVSVIQTEYYSKNLIYNKAKELCFEYNGSLYNFYDYKEYKRDRKDNKTDVSKDKKKIENFLDNYVKSIQTENGEKKYLTKRKELLSCAYDDDESICIEFLLEDKNIFVKFKLISLEHDKIIKYSEYDKKYKVASDEKGVLRKFVETNCFNKTVAKIINDAIIGAGNYLIEYLNLVDEDFKYEVYVKNSIFTIRFIDYIRADEFGATEDKYQNARDDENCQEANIYMYY